MFPADWPEAPVLAGCLQWPPVHWFATHRETNSLAATVPCPPSATMTASVCDGLAARIRQWAPRSLAACESGDDEAETYHELVAAVRTLDAAATAMGSGYARLSTVMALAEPTRACGPIQSLRVILQRIFHSHSRFHCVSVFPLPQSRASGCSCCGCLWVGAEGVLGGGFVPGGWMGLRWGVGVFGEVRCVGLGRKHPAQLLTPSRATSSIHIILRRPETNLTWGQLAALLLQL